MLDLSTNTHVFCQRTLFLNNSKVYTNVKKCKLVITFYTFAETFSYKIHFNIK